MYRNANQMGVVADLFSALNLRNKYHSSIISGNAINAKSLELTAVNSVIII